jgi:hypothetical protein
MADTQGAQPKTGPRLTVIDGGQRCAGGELAELEESLAGLLDQWAPYFSTKGNMTLANDESALLVRDVLGLEDAVRRRAERPGRRW